jgi:hypothetical protein
MWKSARNGHVSGMYFFSVRVKAAIVARVQFRIFRCSPHVVSLCCILSVTPHVAHLSVSARFIAAKRSLVRMMS